MARAAEESGFDSIWLGDHLLYRGDGRRSAGRGRRGRCSPRSRRSTERVELGPLVACAAFHPPGLIAKMAATIARGQRRPLRARARRRLERDRVPRLRAAVRPPRLALRGVVRDRPADARRRARDARRAGSGRRTTPSCCRCPTQRDAADDRLERPADARGRRCPHVDRWNTWYDGYGNTVDGLRRAEARSSPQQAEAVGRDPGGARPQHRGAGRARSGRGQATRTRTSESRAIR